MTDVAWLVPALPALSAVLIALFGKRLPRKGAEVGIAAVGVALAVSIGIAFTVFTANVDAVAAVEAAGEEGGGGADEGEEQAATAGVEVAAAALPSGVLALTEAGEEAIPEGVESFLAESSFSAGDIGGGLPWQIGQRVDGLTAMMFLLVTFVSLMVHVYSTGYMHGDPRYTYFFFLLSLFTSSMLVLVIADGLLQALIGWELVGICSFLLIGFWWEERSNQNAAIKAFLTTKFGDIGLMVGVVTLAVMFGTFDISDMIEAAEAGTQGGGAPLSTGLLTFALLMLFLGAVGKSAQFPLHTWLPDAMAGPTPVSALIHAATMVTAGIFLVARLYPLYELSPVSQTVIAVVGAITLFSAGLLAIVQDDIKRVLAYSTVSQLGYMVAALAFSYTAGIFHLLTHGFFKALLFLGSGSVIHAVHSNNMSDMGGLRRFMPTTYRTWLIGSAALAALPPLAGFWSKDEVLAGAFEAGTYSGNVVWILGLLGGGLTAFYMTRATLLTFHGEFRGHGHPHESPPSMRVPLLILAVPAALIGFINLPFDRFHPLGFAAWTMFDLGYFEAHPAEFIAVLAVGSVVCAAIGIALGWSLYARRYRAPAQDPTNRLGLVSKVLQNRYYLDHLYTGAIVGGIRDKIAPAAYWVNDHVIDRLVYLAGVGTNRLGWATYNFADQKGIDGAVNGVGVGAAWTGGLLKFAQSGNVQFYAGAMFIGVFIFAVLFATA